MINIKQRFNDSPGQALVEFALIIVVLLMMIFLIIESARILWAWNTVQNAAREGARYAITGQAEQPNCAVDFGQPKFVVPGGRDVCDDLRLASVINKAHSHLAGLPLNEESVTFEDGEYYNIEVWGVDQSGQLQYDFAGIPSNPVIVRVTYRVPIITPFFNAILPSIPVFGQETLNNETFGNLGGSGNDAAALPPNLPPVPTPGVTPSPTPSPTPSNTPTVGPTSTSTNTPTATPTPRCDLRFEGAAVVGNDFVFVTGDVDIDIRVRNLTTGLVLGTATLGGPFGDDHACPGFVTVNFSSPLTTDDLFDVLLVEQIDAPDNADTTIVVGSPPTITPSPTNTPAPTNTPTSTPVATNTPTPTTPYIVLQPNCGPGPTIQVDISGFNWPTNQTTTVSWNGGSTIYQTNQGSFTFIYQRPGVTSGTYTIRAQSGTTGPSHTVNFTVPCPGQPTNTPTPVPSATTAPADLLAFAPPKLVSTPPIVAYQPVQFSVLITNTGTVNIPNQFFVDLYLDPTTILTDRIPLVQSDGYSAVSGLDGGASKVITITSPLGFNNTPTNHQIYGMADSVLQISEAQETNNVTQPLFMNNVTPGPTPTPTSNLGGSNQISGGVLALGDDIVPQYRATVTLIDNSSGQILGITSSDINGYYAFNNVPAPATSYTVAGCMLIDGVEWYGFIIVGSVPDTTAHVTMRVGPCP